MIVALAATFALITSIAADLGHSHLEWVFSASLLIIAATTLTQLFGAGRVGGKHFMVIGTSPIYIPLVAHLVQISNYSVLTGFMMIASLGFVAVARWLPALYRVITPVVTGVALFLIYVMILPLAIRMLGAVPEGVSDEVTPVLVCTMIAVMIVLARSIPDSLQVVTPLAGILVGVVIAGAYDWFSYTASGEAVAWINLPHIHFPGIALPESLEVWAILPLFILVGLIHAIRATNDSFEAQKSERGEQSGPDYRLAQGSLYANGLGVFMSSLAGSPPVIPYSGLSVTVIKQSGRAPRITALVICCLVGVIAFSPVIAHAVLRIPPPVLGCILLLAVIKLIGQTIRSLVRACTDREHTIIAWTSSLSGITIITLALLPEIQLFSGGYGAILGNGFVMGCIIAMGMTVVLNAKRSRPQRFDGVLDSAIFPAVDMFLQQVALESKWGPRARLRLRAAVEEAIASQQQVYDSTEKGKAPHLTVRAYPSQKYIDVDILTALESEHVESHLAIMNALPEQFDEDLMSLRLLLHYASKVRCRHYHGLTVITLRITP